MGEEAGEFHKVGIARNPEERLHQVQAGNPRLLCLYDKWDVRPWAVRVESGAHQMLKDHSVGREWFSADRNTCIEAILISARNIADQVEVMTGLRPFDL